MTDISLESLHVLSTTATYIYDMMLGKGVVLQVGRTVQAEGKRGQQQTSLALPAGRLRISSVGRTGERLVPPHSPAGCTDTPKVSEGRDMVGDGLQEALVVSIIDNRLGRKLSKCLYLFILFTPLFFYF